MFYLPEEVREDGKLKWIVTFRGSGVSPTRRGNDPVQCNADQSEGVTQAPPRTDKGTMSQSQDGRIAQLGERLGHIQQAAGSRPVGATKEDKVQMKKAEEIEQGACFRKKGGDYAYLRIGDSSAKFHGLDSESKIYGVAYNGNMTAVERTKLVEPAIHEDMQDNRQSEETWNRDVGGN